MTAEKLFEDIGAGIRAGWTGHETRAQAFAALSEIETILNEREASNTSVDGKVLTWQELVEYVRADNRRLTEKAAAFDDLDRCEHGRHSGDDCGSCGGPSHGNPIAQNAVVGYDIGGRPIVHPFLARALQGSDTEGET